MTAQSVRDAWETGSYDEIDANYLSIAGRLVDRMAVEDGDDVLDVGCGTGSVAITAARSGAEVTGVDITPAMLDSAASNAELAGVDPDWREGDATALPFDDDAFDVVLSSLGHMYGDPPSDATAELLRVTRPEGHIGFTAWTPTSVYPFMAGVVTTYLSPEDLPDFTEPPFMWGDSDVVSDRLGDHVAHLDFTTETAYYPALSPAHFWQEVSTTSGVFRDFLDAVPNGERETLRAEMIETVRPYFDERRNAVELEYLLTTASLGDPG